MCPQRKLKNRKTKITKITDSLKNDFGGWLIQAVYAGVNSCMNFDPLVTLNFHQHLICEPNSAVTTEKYTEKMFFVKHLAKRLVFINKRRQD